MISGNRRKALALSAGLHLQNRFSVLAIDEGLGALSNKASKLAEPEP